MDKRRFWNKIKKTHTCWLWTGAKIWSGYGKLMIEDGIRPSGKRRQRELRAHRVSWEIYNGPIPEGMKVLHICDNPACVNPDHLFLGTQFDNIRDMNQKGRASGGSMPGERNPSAKLTRKKVDEIIRLYEEDNISQTKIAKKFGVSQVLISKIINSKIW